MLTRRDLMRAMSLATLAVAAPQFLTACGSQGKDPSPQGDAGLTFVSSDLERGEGDLDALADAVGSIHALSAGLYGALAATRGNLALSPYSVAVALALTVNGAVEVTAEEMLEVLAATDTDRLNGGLNALTRQVESLAGRHERADGSSAEVALDSANALFGQDTTEWDTDYLDTLARDFGAGMQAVDFIGATEAARTAINTWTAERTHDRIEEIIPTGVLTELTRLVLVNALYLKAPWEVPFEKTLTRPGTFHLEDGTEADVAMMNAALVADLGSGEGWAAVRLAYAGNGLAMTVVLPDEGRLADVEGAIGAGDLPDLLASLRPGQVSLRLPRWTFRTRATLNDTLIGLGMPTAFTDAADFSGMAEVGKDFAIGAVLHEVFIAVDEDGTEAAAATAVVMTETSAMAPDLELVMDRPFLFVIHDVEHGTPLFVGRVADPRQA